MGRELASAVVADAPWPATQPVLKPGDVVWSVADDPLYDAAGAMIRPGEREHILWRKLNGLCAGQAVSALSETESARQPPPTATGQSSA